MNVHVDIQAYTCKITYMPVFVTLQKFFCQLLEPTYAWWATKRFLNQWQGTILMGFLCLYTEDPIYWIGVLTLCRAHTLVYYARLIFFSFLIRKVLQISGMMFWGFVCNMGWYPTGNVSSHKSFGHIFTFRSNGVQVSNDFVTDSLIPGHSDGLRFELRQGL